MDGGAWQATVLGVLRVGYDLVFKQQQQDKLYRKEQVFK